jgi:Phosphodiester glycosidase
MDTHLLSARLYSGSVSPGGGPYKYTAPVAPGAASSLVAAFNGGFKMADAHGGYYTENRVVRPLVRGDASLVIYANGSATVGAWGTDVTMTRSVAAVRQNLFPLVAGGRPSPRAGTRTWRVWGGTCPCGKGQHGSDFQWRSGLGVTADGALVYVAGPQLTPPQLADLLVRAGAVRGMELDINPSWPVFASFKPAAPAGLAAAANGAALIDTARGPATFFDPAYARDFITVSARPWSNAVKLREAQCRCRRAVKMITHAGH